LVGGVEEVALPLLVGDGLGVQGGAHLAALVVVAPADLLHHEQLVLGLELG